MMVRSRISSSSLYVQMSTSTNGWRGSDLSHGMLRSASGVRSRVRVKKTSATVVPSMDSISTTVNKTPRPKSTVRPTGGSVSVMRQSM
jgi:hypothetical protein